MKLTKRKGFNFFRSYFDVYNELEMDKDKVAFIDALLDREFLGTKPTDLKGLAKFAYISQVNSIDSQVKGYEDKTGIKLSYPTAPPTYGATLPPTVQVKEKGKVQGKEEVKEKVQVKVNKDANKKSSLHSKMRELFLKNHLCDENYYWTAKDGSSLKNIITKIKFILKNSGREISDNVILESWEAVLNKLPDWYQTNYSTAIIAGKWNELIKEIKTKQNGKGVNEQIIRNLQAEQERIYGTTGN